MGAVLVGSRYNRQKKAVTDGGRGTPKTTVGQNDPRFTADKLAVEIRLWAERRFGELWIPKLKAKGASAGGKKSGPRGTFLELRDNTPTLADLGIALGAAIEAIETKAAKERQGRPEKPRSGKLPEHRKGRVSEKVATVVGMKRKTYEKAKAGAKGGSSKGQNDTCLTTVGQNDPRFTADKLAAEIRLRAERRFGELWRPTPKADGGDAQRTRFQKGTESPPTLADLGIDKKEV